MVDNLDVLASSQGPLCVSLDRAGASMGYATIRREDFN